MWPCSKCVWSQELCNQVYSSSFLFIDAVWRFDLSILQPGGKTATVDLWPPEVDVSLWFPALQLNRTGGLNVKLRACTEVLVQSVPSEGSWSCRIANEEPLRAVYSRRGGKKNQQKNKITWKWVTLGGRSRISLQWQPPPSSREVVLSPHLAHLLVPNKRLCHEGSHCQKNVPICVNKQTSHLFQGKCGVTMVSRRQVWLVRLQSCTTNVQHWQHWQQLIPAGDTPTKPSRFNLNHT